MRNQKVAVFIGPGPSNSKLAPGSSKVGCGKGPGVLGLDWSLPAGKEGEVVMVKPSTATAVKGSGRLSLILLYKYCAQIEWDAKQARTPTP